MLRREVLNREDNLSLLFQKKKPLVGVLPSISTSNMSQQQSRRLSLSTADGGTKGSSFGSLASMAISGNGGSSGRPLSSSSAASAQSISRLQIGGQRKHIAGGH